MLRLRSLASLTIVIFLITFSYIDSSMTQAQTMCPPGVDVLAMGDTLEGEINDSQSTVSVCFEGNRGDVVKIELMGETGSLDTYLEVTDTFGDDVYATNDDRSLSSTDSEIDFELPTDGVFIINASRFNRENGSTEGTFSLSLTLDSEGGESSSTSDEPGERPEGCPILYDTIRYGQTIADDISDFEFRYSYCFVGTAGDEVIIEVGATSGDLDTILFLTDIRLDEFFAENDDVRLGTRDSRIVYTLPETGPYLITVSRYDLDDGNSEGDFELTLQVNDGSFSDEELYTIRDPNPYECNRPLMRELNATQWLEENEDYNFRLNFGCEGLAVVSIFDEVFDIPYMFDGSDLELIFNEQTYAVNLDSTGQLTLTGQNGGEFTFNDVGRCSTELEQDLTEGVWFFGQNDTFFRLDFLCDGVVIITLESVVEAYIYDLDTGDETLEIGEFGQFWSDVFILPGTQMSVETEDEPLIFTNILTEIDGGTNADL